MWTSSPGRGLLVARGQVVRGYFDLVEKADFQRSPATVEVTVDGR
jgi:hypothetical protein